MPKVDEAELGDDFSYIVRIADTDIDGVEANHIRIDISQGHRNQDIDDDLQDVWN